MGVETMVQEFKVKLFSGTNSRLVESQINTFMEDEQVFVVDIDFQVKESSVVSNDYGHVVYAFMKYIPLEDEDI